MKVILSLIALAALSAVTSVFAQEEGSPSPSPSDEKASATVEAKPEAAATPEETKAQKKEEAATSKSESSTTEKSAAADKKQTTTATTATKSASPAAATATSKKGMSTEAALRDMETKWEDAYSKHDTATIEMMVAEDFVGVSTKNKVLSRRGLLSDAKNDKDTYTSAKNEKMDVHMYGKDVAVVVGTAREKGTGKDGKAFDRAFRYTDTWMNRGGKWQCVASQVALVSSK